MVEIKMNGTAGSVAVSGNRRDRANVVNNMFHARANERTKEGTLEESFKVLSSRKERKKGAVNGSRVPSDASERKHREGIRKSKAGNYADCRLESIF